MDYSDQCNFANQLNQKLDLEQAISLLSARQKQCLNLRQEGYTYQEIANQLNISIRTVRTHLKRAKRRIMSHL